MAGKPRIAPETYEEADFNKATGVIKAACAKKSGCCIAKLETPNVVTGGLPKKYECLGPAGRAAVTTKAKCIDGGSSSSSSAVTLGLSFSLLALLITFKSV